MEWFLRRYHGFMVVKLRGYSPERFLNHCNAMEIPVWNLKYRDGASPFSKEVPCAPCGEGARRPSLFLKGKSKACRFFGWVCPVFPDALRPVLIFVGYPGGRKPEVYV